MIELVFVLNVFWIVNGDVVLNVGFVVVIGVCGFGKIVLVDLIVVGGLVFFFYINDCFFI